MLKQSSAKRCNERERGDQIKLPGRRGPGCTAGLIDHNYHPICFVPGIFPSLSASRGPYHRLEEEGIRKNVRNLCSDRDNVLQNFNANRLIH